MSGRGLHIALSDQELSELLELPEHDVADFIADELEEKKFDTIDAYETDKSWSYIHAALNETDPDGDLAVPQPAKSGLLSRVLGARPLPDVGAAKFAIAGYRQLVVTDDYFVGLIPADQVEGVATCLALIPTSHLSERVVSTHKQFHAAGSPQDASDYALSWFPGLVEFFGAASAANKHIIFTVDF